MEFFRPWSVFALRRQPRAPQAPRPPREPLDGHGRMLLGQLPPSLSLAATAKAYPHVVNRLGRAWSDPLAFDREMGALLLQDRVRAGFPFEVVIELGEVRGWYQSRTAGARGGARHVLPG